MFTRVVAPLGELVLVVWQQLLNIVVDGLAILLDCLDDTDLNKDDLLGAGGRNLVELGCHVGCNCLGLHDLDVILATISSLAPFGLKIGTRFTIHTLKERISESTSISVVRIPGILKYSIVVM
jgi:hypothetical protein